MIDVSDVIERFDFVSYVQTCTGETLVEKPDGCHWCLSPFTSEKTPSFSVNNTKKTYCDFSSGNRGGVIDFICRFHRCSTREAINKLAEFAGVEDDDGVAKPRRLQATSVAKKFRQEQHPGKQFTGTYLADDYMDRYVWDEEKLSAWTDEGITPESLRRFQVRYDPFGNRIVYPLRDQQGRIINIGGRTLDPQWKEKGLHKYIYYHKFGTLNTIYGLYENREEIARTKEVILFEGAKSVMLAYGWGFRNTGAILTSHMSKAQFDVLARLGVNVTFALDKEVEVWRDKQVRRLTSYTSVYYIHDWKNLLDEKMAPVDKGREVFEQLLSERRRLR